MSHDVLLVISREHRGRVLGVTAGIWVELELSVFPQEGLLIAEDQRNECVPWIAFEERSNASEGLSGLAVCSSSRPGETDVLIRFLEKNSLRRVYCAEMR